MDIYNSLSHFLEITLRFHFTTPSRVMLKLVVLASRKLPTTKSLTFRHGIKLSSLLALIRLVNPIPNVVLSPLGLKRSRARQTGMSLRVTKCHRAAIFDRAYLRARARYGCDFNSYRTILWISTINSLTFWRSHSVFILQRHLG